MKYPRLPVCVLADSLYASEPVFQRCLRDNHWHMLLRYNEGSIPSIAEEYRSIAGILLQRGSPGSGRQKGT